jgi:hypothetical protein
MPGTTQPAPRKEVGKVSKLRVCLWRRATSVRLSEGAGGLPGVWTGEGQSLWVEKLWLPLLSQNSVKRQAPNTALANPKE